MNVLAPAVPKELSDYVENLLGRSPKTKANYDSFLNVFWTFIKNKPFKDVTVEDVMAFLQDGMQNHSWKLTTMRQYATLAMLFFGEFRDEEFIKKLKKEMRKLPRIPFGVFH